LANAATSKIDALNLSVPNSVPGVDDKLLVPKNNWQDSALYDEYAKRLASEFIANFVKYDVSEEIRQAGPQA
jgi:phosphoenolpyruvate carboxykinase (ATP)